MLDVEETGASLHDHRTETRDGIELLFQALSLQLKVTCNRKHRDRVIDWANEFLICPELLRHCLFELLNLLVLTQCQTIETDNTLIRTSRPFQLVWSSRSL
jgi:hypothetical protein